MRQWLGQTSITGKRRPGHSCALVSLAIVLGITAAGVSDGRAQSFALIRYNRKGSFDQDFGRGGGVLTSFRDSSGDEARAVAIQPDGKIVVAGIVDAQGAPDFALVRYNADGGQDTTFGNQGRVRTDFATRSPDEAYTVAMQADGKIVVGGSTTLRSNQNFALVRYRPNGNLDTTFGQGGRVDTDFSPFSRDAIRAIALQADGKIVAAGVTTDQTGGAGYDFALVRYLPDGRPDTTFGTQGKVRTNLGRTSFGTGTNDEAHAMALQPDGKIVVAGFSGARAEAKFALVRYHPDGRRDTTFGMKGRVLTDVIQGRFEEAFALAIQADGKIVAAGQAEGGFPSPLYIALVRYDADGRRDRTFGRDGIVLTGFGEGNRSWAHALALQADGKLIVAGASINDFALVRYHPDGTIDETFGDGGGVLAGFDTETASNDQAAAVAIQTNGKIVAVGSSEAQRGGPIRK